MTRPFSGRNPFALYTIVIAGRNGAADRGVNEILGVVDHGSIEADIFRAGGIRFIHAELSRIRVTGHCRQIAGHGLNAAPAYRIFGGAHIQCTKRLCRTVRQRYDGPCAGRKEQRRLPLSVFICNRAAARYLNSGGRGQVNGRDLRIQRRHDHRLKRHILAPSGLHCTLHGQVARLCVGHDHCSAVDDQIVQAVSAAERLTVFRMIVDRHGHTRQRLSITGQDLTAEHGHALGRNRAGSHTCLDRIVAAVEECGGLKDVGRHTSI